ncbi:MAG: SAM-dependent methyltransferase [Firmicutes bacterium]|nr:SAM-dependent methyltransferase [Bacillota bacterium]
MNELPFSENIYKILLSSPVKNSETEYTRVEILSNGEKYQASMFTAKQVFHKNLHKNDVKPFVDELLGTAFSQYTAWDGKREYSARVTKKGRLLTTSKVSSKQPQTANFKSGTFNKQKNHIIREGEPIPALVDMGVFTKEYKVATQMHDKFQQINRFIELIADETKNLNSGTTVNIIDFGCGKSYLTFLVYHFFTEICKLPVNICGLDLNESVIESCTKAAEKYGYTSLVFKLGDIGNQTEPPIQNWGKPKTFNIVISLHACDTATDYALFNAINWNADLICAVPCCQHELRNQMKPRSLDIFTNYGIIEERVASLATDAIRAKLLEHMGYKAQIIEFTPMEHTAKNLLIRARRDKKNHNALESVQKIIEEFSLQPILMKLLQIRT